MTASWMPLVGAVDVEVHDARAISIHGDGYVDLLASPPGAEPAPFRVMASAIGGVPQRGERLRLHLLMSQVDRVERLDPA
ncbi:MAG: hypothetical protein ACO3SJ_09350 [Phycisphaerales bacterium]